MKRSNLTKRKFCILSKNEISSLSEFLSLSINDTVKDLSYSNFSISELEKYSPDAIIIDDYYTKCNYNIIIDSIIHKFPDTQVYVISPKYSEYNNVISSCSSKNHYFSNLNEKILQLINSTQGADPSTYLTAC
tara:strand:- start:1496 stop:1894 length:399 start_codon:yes stop_codon:yes gene_type:complete